MEEIRISFTQIGIYVVVINIILGFLLGSFPLICGIKMKKRNYGIYGFIGSIIGGTLLGIFLSYPIAIIFTWLILRNTEETVEVNSESPKDVSIESSDIS